MQPFGTKKITQPLGTNKNHATSWEKKNYATSWDKKSPSISGQIKIMLPFRGEKNPNFFRVGPNRIVEIQMDPN